MDIVGNIAIVEKRAGAKQLLANKNIKTVLLKTSKRTGKYRLQKHVWLAGEKTTITEHKESGVRILVDVAKCYFSPRLSTERSRIAGLVRNGEEVLVMFSGVAPFALVIAKNAKPKSIVCIEHNAVASEFAEKNVKLNKFSNVKIICGDVKSKLPKKKFDRVLMPAPKTGENFLELGLKAVKKNGFLHFYDFAPEEDVSCAADKVKSACKVAKRKCKVLRTVLCGQHAPRIFRVCVDVKLD